MTTTKEKKAKLTKEEIDFQIKRNLKLKALIAKLNGELSKSKKLLDSQYKKGVDKPELIKGNVYAIKKVPMRLGSTINMDKLKVKLKKLRKLSTVIKIVKIEEIDKAELNALIANKKIVPEDYTECSWSYRTTLVIIADEEAKEKKAKETEKKKKAKIAKAV